MIPWTLALPAAGWVLGIPLLGGYGRAAAYALLIAFPLILHLDHQVPEWLRRLTAVAAPFTAVSLLLPQGVLAASLAGLWLLITGLHLAYGVLRWLTGVASTPTAPWVWAEAMAAAGPVVAAVALVSSRYAGVFSGFPEPLATLTVPHFHVTFGILPLTLAALARSGHGARGPLWGMVLLPPLIGAMLATRTSFFVPGTVEAGTIVLLALVLAAWTATSWRRLRNLSGPSGILAPLAALLLTASVSLAPVFAVTSARGLPLLDYGQMLALHGVGNAVATTLLALVVLRHAAFDGIPTVPHPPDLAAPTRDISPSQALFLDQRSLDLGPDAPDRFARLADALLRYDFYPPTVMVAQTTFPDRPARVGDRVGMALLVPLLPGFPAVRFPATTEIHLAERSENHVAFGYTTTTAHYGAGAWEARLLRQDGRLILQLSSRMRPSHPLALAGLPLYRWFQKRAHHAGMSRLGSLG